MTSSKDGAGPSRSRAPRKAAAGKASTSATRTTTGTTRTTGTGASTPRAPRKRRGAGLVETATFNELKGLNLLGTALSTAAVAMARNIDEAQTAAGAAAASRELRQTLMLTRAIGNPLSPAKPSGGSPDPARSQADQAGGEPGDGDVVPADRLEQLRRRAGDRPGR